MRRLPFLIALLFTAAAGRAQLPAEPKPPLATARPNLAVELHCVSLPQTLAVPIVRRLRTGDLAEQAKVMTELDEMVAGGKASLQGWLIATTHSGEKASAEDHEELRYPTEFTLAQAEVYLADKDGDLSPQLDKIRVDTVPTASAFDSRSVGVTLEVEPTIATDGKALEISFVASHVSLKAVDRVVVEREFAPEKKSQKTIVEQPRFTDLSVHTSTSMKDGEHRLVGIFRGPEGEKSLELFILSVRVLDVR